MEGYVGDTLNLVLTAVLIILNGFFVATEFALVKVNKSKIKSMQKDNNPFASVALWLYNRQSMALSACQMGITMASLALGWIGEPALAHLLKPVLESLGITSEAILHGTAFAIAFTAITALHIVIGEQFPKIYAIRKPIPVVGWSSLPLKFFYILFYPFMWSLDRITAWLLRFVGIESDGEHESILTEDEIRSSLSIAYNQGDLTRHEHELLDAAFRFDDQIARQIMVPRNEITYFDVNQDFSENLKLAKKTMHTRFPICNGSLDQILGVVHIKDLLGYSEATNVEIEKLSRKPVFVPETLPIHLLLSRFQRLKQHLAFIEDEYGTVMGMVTLENVIEQLVGEVQDEFDSETPDIVKEGPGKYLIDGDVSISQVNDTLDLNLEGTEAETLSGLLVEATGFRLKKGQMIDLKNGVSAEVIEMKERRAIKVRVSIASGKVLEHD